MAGSSPARQQSLQWTSPRQSVISEILIGDVDRNSEARHKLLIEAAKREHDRVREQAERIYEAHLQKEEQTRILDERRREEERIKQEEQLAAERRKLLELRKKQVEIPPLPPPPPEPAPVQAAPVPAAAPKAPSSADAPNAPKRGSFMPVSDLLNGTSPKPTPEVAILNGQPTAPKPPLQPSQPASANPFAPLSQAAPSRIIPAPISQPPPATKAPYQTLPGRLQETNGTSTSRSSPQLQAPQDRYTVIHKNLKVLRKSLTDQALRNSDLKSRLGNMRREIRKNVGQLTGGGAAVNKRQQTRINEILREGLTNQVNSKMVDPHDFLLEPRQPVEGARHNEPELPSIFLYCVNILAKSAISQFLNEAAARPETADPVGVVLATTFSDPDFLWRGQSLIDILLAKFRVVCPVLFGYNGNEATEQGRLRLGWWKKDGVWVSEQQHMDRMTGLGAGFAAISLRNFGRAKKQNPYPPRNYWTAMARIVNTPSAEISNTQCVVLKSMIEHYEQKFFYAYGTAAIAALRVALIEFPARASQKSSAVSSLEVLAHMLKRDTGLNLF